MAHEVEGGRGEFEEALWCVLVYAMTHASAGDRLSMTDVCSRDIFDISVLPTLRRALARWVQALVLEALVEHGTFPPDAGDPTGDDA